MKRIKYCLLIPVGMVCSMATLAQLTPQQAHNELGRGINIGNTLETPTTEGSWGNGPMQEYYFDDYKAAGFTNVRIPVRWGDHMLNEYPFTIDSVWMARVEQVVDWGLSRDLYIIINSHHDNWIKENYANPLVRERFDSLWSQVSRRFADRSEKLFFQMINEPKGLTQSEINELNARVLGIIRRTNPTRIVVYSGHEWSNAEQLMSAAIPNDPYVMGYYHSYDPYQFGINGQGTWGSNTERTQMRNKISMVKAWSVQNNIPVLLSEFGATNTMLTNGNPSGTADFNSRMRYYAAYIEGLIEFDLPFSVWDDGGWFRMYNRAGRTWNHLKNIVINYPSNAPHLPAISLVDYTHVRLTWTNKTNDADSILVLRGTSETNLEMLGSIPASSTEFLDTATQSNRTYFYQLATHYNDSITLYAHPLAIRTQQAPTAVRGIQTDNGLMLVYPNPASSTISITHPEGGLLGKINIHDNLGRLVKSVTTSNQSICIPIDDLKHGTYIVRMVLNGREVSTLFVKR